MRFYQPDEVVHETLEAAIATGQSFVAATDDHQYAMFIDWAEYEDDERAALFAVCELEPDEQEREFVAAFFERDAVDAALGSDPHDGIEDALVTLARWQGGVPR